jgi:hypothetical protein
MKVYIADLDFERATQDVFELKQSNPQSDIKITGSNYTSVLAFARGGEWKPPITCNAPRGHDLTWCEFCCSVKNVGT